MGPDPFGTGTKLVRISLVFTRDLVDPLRIRSAIWYQMGPLMKVILSGTVPVQNRSRINRVDPYQSGSDPKRTLTYSMPCKRCLKQNLRRRLHKYRFIDNG